jgi:hypothetical protein
VVCSNRCALQGVVVSCSFSFRVLQVAYGRLSPMTPLNIRFVGDIKGRPAEGKTFADEAKGHALSFAKVSLKCGVGVRQRVVDYGSVRGRATEPA